MSGGGGGGGGDHSRKQGQNDISGNIGLLQMYRDIEG